LFLIDGIRDFGSLSEEIKILAYRLFACSCWLATTKCIIIEGIVRLVQLVTKTIICILEIKT
jgi:hypothetical protein